MKRAIEQNVWKAEGFLCVAMNMRSENRYARGKGLKPFED